MPATTKAKIKNSKLRDPYYKLSDSVKGFIKVKPLEDKKLNDMAKKMDSLLDEMYKHLEKNYICD